MLSLSRNARYSRRQREIIFQFKSMHLKQQSIERAALQGKKDEACSSSFDAAGNPTHCLLFSDGMTKHAAISPKYGLRQSKKDTSFFENRVIGVEVYCGDIRDVILVHCDELVRGGANFMIEVHRVVMGEVSKRLAEMGKQFPQYIHFQLDNCGENKNKEFMLYCTILKELYPGIIKEITLGRWLLPLPSLFDHPYSSPSRAPLPSCRFSYRGSHPR